MPVLLILKSVAMTEQSKQKRSKIKKNHCINFLIKVLLKSTKLFSILCLKNTAIAEIRYDKTKVKLNTTMTVQILYTQNNK